MTKATPHDIHPLNLPIPPTPTDLSTEWLTAALRQGGNAGPLTVTAFQAQPLAISQGFYGQVVRLQLDYTKDSPGGPRTLIAKFSSATPAMKQRSVDSYAREVGFYQRLARSSDLPTPTCYYANIDLSSGDHVLLLQDLAPARSGSRVAGCTPDQARLAMAEITKFHARWWGRTEGEELAWLNDDANLDVEQMRQQYDQWWPAFYQAAQERLPESLKALSQELGSRRAALRRGVFHSEPRTLIHRDYQVENIFLGGGEAQGHTHAPGFAVIDWQFLSRGRGVWDVTYFLSESLLTADRRRLEMELLADYQRALNAQGIGDYSFEQCLNDYRLCLLQRHTALVSTIAAMPFSAEQRRIHLDILLPRNIAAILDHDAFATPLP